jgi:hypothetical protein
VSGDGKPEPVRAGKHDRRSVESTLESAPFLVDGGTLTFRLAGENDSRIRVELVVDGQVVLRARAPNSSFFFPVLWDVRIYRGKHATLRLVDATAHSALFVDDIRLLGTLEAASAATAEGSRAPSPVLEVPPRPLRL